MGHHAWPRRSGHGDVVARHCTSRRHGPASNEVINCVLLRSVYTRRGARTSSKLYVYLGSSLGVYVLAT